MRSPPAGLNTTDNKETGFLPGGNTSTHVNTHKVKRTPHWLQVNQAMPDKRWSHQAETGARCTPLSCL